MSAIVHGQAASQVETPRFTLFCSMPVMIAVSIVMVLAAGSRLVGPLWNDGVFLDTDDAMRMVEVRDFMAGQAWFDLTAYRLDPSHAPTMHWSRLVDAPLVALTSLFGLIVDATTAERLMRLVWPVALHTVLLLSFVTTARRLMGEVAIAPAAFLAAVTFVTSAQFIPGRIDHHGVEIVAMMLMLRATIDAVAPDTRSWRAAALAGAIAMVALAVSLEDLPFVAVTMAAFALAWVVEGERMRPPLFAFGASLAASAIVAFVATVPARSYSLAYCDAYTIPHALGIVAGGAALALLALVGRRLGGWRLRLAASAVAGAAVLGGTLLLYPACAGNPLAGVDPVVRDLWLTNVSEARSLLLAMRQQTVLFIPIVVPLLLGLIGLAWALWLATPAQRWAWFPIAMLAAVGLALALWQVRMLGPVAILAAFGSVFAIAWTVKHPWRTLQHLYGAVALTFVVVCPLAWSAALTPLSSKAEEAGGKALETCLAPKSFEALAQMPKGLVLAPIDLGAHILAFTPHSVLAAPYHRNNRGNRTVIETMLGTPDAAREATRHEGATYVVTCGLPELELYNHKAPDGFAARLKAGNVPAWLEPRPASGGLSIFRTRG